MKYRQEKSTVAILIFLVVSSNFVDFSSCLSLSVDLKSPKFIQFFSILHVLAFFHKNQQFDTYFASFDLTIGGNCSGSPTRMNLLALIKGLMIVL